MLRNIDTEDELFTAICLRVAALKEEAAERRRDIEALKGEVAKTQRRLALKAPQLSKGGDFEEERDKAHAVFDAITRFLLPPPGALLSLRVEWRGELTLMDFPSELVVESVVLKMAKLTSFSAAEMFVSDEYGQYLMPSVCLHEYFFPDPNVTVPHIQPSVRLHLPRGLGHAEYSALRRSEAEVRPSDDPAPPAAETPRRFDIKSSGRWVGAHLSVLMAVGILLCWSLSVGGPGRSASYGDYVRARLPNASKELFPSAWIDVVMQTAALVSDIAHPDSQPLGALALIQRRVAPGPCAQLWGLCEDTAAFGQFSHSYNSSLIFYAGSKNPVDLSGYRYSASYENSTALRAALEAEKGFVDAQTTRLSLLLQLRAAPGTVLAAFVSFGLDDAAPSLWITAFEPHSVVYRLVLASTALILALGLVLTLALRLRIPPTYRGMLYHLSAPALGARVSVKCHELYFLVSGGCLAVYTLLTAVFDIFFEATARTTGDSYVDIWRSWNNNRWCEELKRAGIACCCVHLWVQFCSRPSRGGLGRVFGPLLGRLLAALGTGLLVIFPLLITFKDLGDFDNILRSALFGAPYADSEQMGVMPEVLYIMLYFSLKTSGQIIVLSVIIWVVFASDPFANPEREKTPNAQIFSF